MGRNLATIGSIGLVVFAMAFPWRAWGAGALPDKLHLQDALLKGRFDVLEAELRTMQREYLSGAYNDQRVGYAFSAFESTNPAFERQFAAWLERFPTSAFAHTASGAYLEHLGWTARGARYATDTRDEQFALMAEHFHAARKPLLRAVGLDASLSIAHAYLIRMSKAVDSREEPGMMVEEALKKGPHSFEVRYQYLYGLQPKWGGSLTAIARFIDTLPEATADRLLAPLRGFTEYVRGEEMYRAKRYEEAAALFTAALRSGKFALYYMARGAARQKLGNLSEALADFDTALLLEPQNPDALYARASFLVDMTRLDQAKSDLDLALRLDPLEPSYLRLRGVVNRRLGQLEDAMQDYRRSLTYAPANANTFVRMGTIEAGRKNYLHASGYYQKAAELEPDEAEHWYDFATAMYYRKECEVRYPLAQFQRVCAGNEADACTEARLGWAKKIKDFIGSQPACANVTDDTRPDPVF